MMPRDIPRATPTSDESPLRPDQMPPGTPELRWRPALPDVSAMVGWTQIVLVPFLIGGAAFGGLKLFESMPSVWMASLAFAVTFLAVLALVDRWANFYVRWVLANHTADPVWRDRVRDLWARRWEFEVWQPSPSGGLIDPRAPVPARYVRRMAVLILPLVLFPLSYRIAAGVSVAQRPPLDPQLVVSWLVLWSAWWYFKRCPAESQVSLWTILHNALRIWFWFDDHELPHGKHVYTSGSASSPTRRLVTTLILAAFAVATVYWARATRPDAFLAYPLTLIAAFLAAAEPFRLYVDRFDSEERATPYAETGYDLDWEAIVDTLQHSQNPTEARCLYLGRLAETDDFVMYPRDSLVLHAWILGRTGTGKTSKAMAPLIDQVVRHAGRLKDCSVLVIDLKGESPGRAGFLNGVRFAAHRAGVPFHLVTNAHQATKGWNPFLQKYVRNAHVNDRRAMLMKCLGLYMRGVDPFFAKMCEMVLLFYLGLPEIDSFRTLQYYLTRRSDLYLSAGGDAEHLRHAQGLLASINQLAAPDFLNVSRANGFSAELVDRQLDVTTFVETPQVGFVHLQNVRDHRVSIAAQVKLLLSSLTLAASDARNPLPVYVFVDEIQQALAGEELAEIFAQARDKGVGLICANQNIGQLVQSDPELSEVMQANTSLRICFAANDRTTRDWIIEQSGETLDWLHSSTSGMSGDNSIHTESTSETIRPRITAEEVLYVSSTPDLCFVQILDPGTYTPLRATPQIVEMNYFVTYREWERRQEFRWIRACESEGYFIDTEYVPQPRPRVGPVRGGRRRTTSSSPPPDERPEPTPESAPEPPERPVSDIHAATEDLYEDLLRRRGRRA